MFEGLITIVVAVIGGLFAIVQLAIAKDHKISEFRKEWIEKAREEFGCASSAIKAYYMNKNSSESLTKWREENFSGALRNIQKILNWIGIIKGKKSYSNSKLSDLEKSLKDIEDYLIKDHEKSPVKNQIPELIHDCLLDAEKNINTVFELEWNKIQTGERISQLCPWIKVISFTIIMLIVMIAVFFYSCNRKEVKATPGNSFEFSVISQKLK